MSDTSIEFYTRQAAEARGPEPQGPPKRKRKKLKRVLIASGTSLVLLVGAVVAIGLFYANHLASSVKRIQVTALTAKDQPAAAPGSMTILLTDTQVMPGQNTTTGLVELLHINPGDHRGAVICIPANTWVKVPGHGKMELGQTLAIGGPSLMVETLERLTHVDINHYSAVDFAGLPSVVGAMHGVDVDVPYSTISDGFRFPRGINDLNSADVLAYVRQPGVSEIGREYLQGNLLRDILDKIARDHFFRPSMENVRVLDAVVHAVSVDSDLSNSQLTRLALSLGHLSGRDGTFVIAPIQKSSPGKGGTKPVHLALNISRKLWAAINNNSVASFAVEYPGLVLTTRPG